MLVGSRGRRRRRTAFWLLASRRLAVAVMEPTADEPLLIACAALVVEGAPPSDVAPGLLETAAAAEALDCPHVAALDGEWCRLQTRDGALVDGPGAGEWDDEVVDVEVRGSAADLRVLASRAAVERVARRFAAARLRLVGLDAGACALLSLALYLGRTRDDDVRLALAAAHDCDPLTAVSVAPDCEAAAARAGAALAVPVGLALARFGLVHDA